MHPETARFAAELAGLHPQMSRAWLAAQEIGEANEFTVLPFADMARELYNVFPNLSDAERRSTFAVVETGAGDPGNSGTAVLTCFVETIADLVADCEEWQEIRSYLGPVSRAHGDGWLSFHGLGRWSEPLSRTAAAD